VCFFYYIFLVLIDDPEILKYQFYFVVNCVFLLLTVCNHPGLYPASVFVSSKRVCIQQACLSPASVFVSSKRVCIQQACLSITLGLI